MKRLNYSKKIKNSELQPVDKDQFQQVLERIFAKLAKIVTKQNAEDQIDT